MRRHDPGKGNRPKRTKRKEPAIVTLPPGLLVAYTDGSTYQQNPGPMAWAVVYIRDGIEERVVTGALYQGTNNRAELLAIITALEHCRDEDLLVRTDSAMSLNCITGRWKRRRNLELWERYDRALAARALRGLVTTFEHVKGHAHDDFNARADALARAAAAQAVPDATDV